VVVWVHGIKLGTAEPYSAPQSGFFSIRHKPPARRLHSTTERNRTAVARTKPFTGKRVYTPVQVGIIK
jgi:hypothetical protein